MRLIFFLLHSDVEIATTSEAAATNSVDNNSATNLHPVQVLQEKFSAPRAPFSILMFYCNFLLLCDYCTFRWRQWKCGRENGGKCGEKKKKVAKIGEKFTLPFSFKFRSKLTRQCARKIKNSPPFAAILKASLGANGRKIGQKSAKNRPKISAISQYTLIIIIIIINVTDTQNNDLITAPYANDERISNSANLYP